MTEAAETVHVACSASSAGTLRKALPLLGSKERVIGLPDSLSVGPIDPPNPKARQAWSKSTLRNVIEVDPAEVEKARADATALDIHPVFWVCLRSPMEHACFLAYASRLEGRCVDIVDVTDVAHMTAGGVRHLRSLGQLRAREIVASRIYKTRRALSAAELRAASMRWAELRRENAPLRIVKGGRLVSAPLTHYDNLLVEQASQDWEIAPRLIGRMFDKLFSLDALAGEGTNDAVLFGRMLALGETGALEVRGRGARMLDYQVRRSAG